MSEPVDVVIGLDAGTTSTKLVAVDPSGAIVATASSDTIATDTSAPGAGVQSAADIWAALTTASRRGIDALGPARIHATATAAQSGSVIPVTGDITSEAITWMDSRSRPIVEGWDSRTVGAIRARSGWMPSPGLGLSTISWLRARTDAPVDADHWCSVDDYLMGKLTGSWITNPSNAAGMQFMDVTTTQWSKELCDIAGIAPSSLSPIGVSGEPSGPITDEAALESGLPLASPIVIGGHDQACGALGLGVTTPGSALLSMGTAWVLTVVTDRAEISGVPDTFNLSPYVLPERWSISQNLGGLGAALSAALAESADNAEALDAALASRSPRLDDPFFLPAVDDPERGGWGRFTDEAAASDPTIRVRTVMEACAFETRRSVEEASPRVTLHELTVIGGGTKSRYLTQLIADVVGVPLTVRPDASWPALGAALLAATAAGWPPPSAPSLPKTTVRPRPDDIFAQRYVEYRRLITGVRP